MIFGFALKPSLFRMSVSTQRASATCRGSSPRPSTAAPVGRRLDQAPSPWRGRVVYGDELLVLRIGRRQHVLRRRREAAVDPHERVAVDRVVDGLPHLEVVERLRAGVHEEVVRVRRRVDLQLARVLRLDGAEPVDRDRVVVVVGLAVDHPLQRGGVVLRRSVDGHLVGVRRRDFGSRLRSSGCGRA